MNKLGIIIKKIWCVILSFVLIMFGFTIINVLLREFVSNGPTFELIVDTIEYSLIPILSMMLLQLLFKVKEKIYHIIIFGLFLLMLVGLCVFRLVVQYIPKELDYFVGISHFIIPIIINILGFIYFYKIIYFFTKRKGVNQIPGKR